MKCLGTAHRWLCIVCNEIWKIISLLNSITFFMLPVKDVVSLWITLRCSCRRHEYKILISNTHIVCYPWRSICLNYMPHSDGTKWNRSITNNIHPNGGITKYTIFRKKTKSIFTSRAHSTSVSSRHNSWQSPQLRIE